MLDRLVGRLRGLRARRTVDEPEGDLREFVYLDEVSVYSLIASRSGSIPSEFRETRTTSAQGEVEGSMSGNSLVLKGDLKPRASIGRTQGSEVLRKSTVQGAFKELYEREEESLVACPMDGGKEPPKLHSLKELEGAAKSGLGEGWIVDPGDLVRGRLLQAEVQLEAERIFAVRAVVSAFVDIMEGGSELFGVDARGALVQVRAIDQILEKLLVGLVPIRGQATDYWVVPLDGKEWVVHHKLLEALEDGEAPPMRPLCLVGLAEERLFWKDIRQVLFPKARFRVFCRVARDGLQDTWSPVQLGQVLEAVAPGMAAQLDGAGSAALARGWDSNGVGRGLALKQQCMQKALVGYAVRLAEHYSWAVAPDDLHQLNLMSWQVCGSCDTQKERRAALDVVGKYVLSHVDVKADPVVLAQFREAALEEAGLDPFGQPVQSTVVGESRVADAPCDVRFLESEFVAIYW